MDEGKELHEFDDLDKFSRSVAKFVARSSGYTFKELKRYIRLGNVKKIIKNHAQFIEDHYVITEEDAHEACEEILDWLVGVELASLASDGVLDCWWDNDRNQMVFQSVAKKP